MRASLIGWTLISTLVASAALAQSPYLNPQSTANASKDNFPYWYLGLNAQLSFVDDSDISRSSANLGEIEHDTAYALGASIGFRPYTRNSFLSDTRYELEYAYRDVDADSLSVGGTSSRLNSGFVSHSIMVNMFYDIDTGTSWTPYIGGGLGMAFTDLESPTLNIDDSDELFAYQGMLGLTYSPEALPQTEWGVGYRYVGMQDPELTDASGNSVEMDYGSHNFEVFSRFRF